MPEISIFPLHGRGWKQKKSHRQKALNPDDSFYNLRLVLHAGIHRMLNIIQLEIIRHDILDPDLSRRNGLDCHGINISIAEHGLKGQLLVKGHADRKRHLSRSAVAHEHNRRSLFGSLNQLGSRDLGSCRDRSLSLL